MTPSFLRGGAGHCLGPRPQWTSWMSGPAPDKGWRPLLDVGLSDGCLPTSVRL